MNPEPDHQLDAQIDAALKSLPTLKAPPSFIRSVLARLEEQRQVPWWRRSWWEWPVAAKAAFAVLTLVLAAFLSGGGFILTEGAEAYSRQFAGRFTTSAFQTESVASLWNAGQLLWNQALHPLLHQAAIAALVLYLICVGLGTACYRFATKHAS